MLQTQESPSHTPVRRNILLLMLIILLVIASSIGIFFFSSGGRMIADGIQATATVQLNAIATSSMGTTIANVSATGTAQTNATATAQSQRAATASVNVSATEKASLVTPYNLLGKSLAVDNSMRMNSSSSWNTFSRSDSFCTFSGDVYHMDLSSQNYLQPCLAVNTNFSNFVYQVQLKVVKGNRGGIVFRAAVGSNTDTYYYFQINVNGSYTWGIAKSAGYSELSTHTSPAIKRGLNQTNLVAVAARGKNFDFYINKQHVATFSDGTYSHGPIGLCVEDDNSATEAVFSNVRLWTL